MPRSGAKQKVLKSKDSKEHPDKLLVQPEDGVTAIIQGLDRAKQSMLRILAEKSKAGVEIKILGRAAKIPARKLSHIRLHARVIVRDGSYVSIGSQSLRTLELDSRREVGVVFRDLKSARRITKVFMSDWELAAEPRTGDQVDETIQTGKIAKKVAKAVTKELPPVAEVLDLVIKEVAGNGAEMPLNPDQLQDTVKHAIKRAVKEAVREAVTDAAEQGGTEPPG